MSSSYVPKNILVFGATGAIGRYIVNALLENKSSFGKIAAFTHEDSIKSKPELFEKAKSRGVEIITGDLTDETQLAQAYKGWIL
jgi:uncharacterized protein YbjT (DUF2867 family)